MQLPFRRSTRYAQGALDRCRLLANQIESDLNSKNAKHFTNLWELADFQTALEHAASVLEQNSDVHKQSVSSRCRPPLAISGPEGQPAVPSIDRACRRAC